MTTISGPTGFSTDELAGRELYVSAPDDGDKRIRAGHIIANTFTTMIVRDTDSDDIASAIWDSDGGAPIRGFCVLDFREKPFTEVQFTVTSETFTHGVTIIEHDGDFIGIESGWDIPDIDTGELAIELILPGELHFLGDVTGQFTVLNSYTAVRPGDWEYPTNGGIWTSDADEDSGTTTFTDSNANFQSYMVGWTLIPNVEKPNFLIVTGWASATEIEVQGNAENLGNIGNIYRLAPAPGCCVTHGTLSEPDNQGARTFEDPGTMWLWSGYQYVPPQVGLNISGTAEGEQSGSNKLGSYHCWNRTYDVFTGRWTTPDSVANPWRNLFGYGRHRPAQVSDPSGLSSKSKKPAPDDPSADADGQKERETHIKTMCDTGCMVEVLVFETGGFQDTGHVDIAVTDKSKTTVYGKHEDGNNSDLKGSTWKKMGLKQYVEEEWGAKEKVRVCRKCVECDTLTKVRDWLQDRWDTKANDYSALDDNCSHNVGYVLKEFGLLKNWDATKKNEIDDDDFKFPEGDLYDDWLAKDDSWTCTESGYIKKAAGKSLYDSWQKNKPEGKSSKGSGGSSGSS